MPQEAGAVLGEVPQNILRNSILVTFGWLFARFSVRRAKPGTPATSDFGSSRRFGAGATGLGGAGAFCQSGGGGGGWAVRCALKAKLHVARRLHCRPSAGLCDLKIGIARQGFGRLVSQDERGVRSGCGKTEK